jgi:hypothetical protein
MIDVFEAFEEFMVDYTFTRYVVTNTYAGESKVGTPHTVKSYIHPNDPAKELYNGQGTRVESSIKIFGYQGADIQIDDEVVYNGQTYKVFSYDLKIVGSYVKALAELVK